MQFFASSDFYPFYDGPVDMRILAFLTRSQCRATDTQVTVKTRGPLVFKYYHLADRTLTPHSS